MTELSDEYIVNVQNSAIEARDFIYGKANGDQAAVATILSLLVAAELASLHPAAHASFLMLFLKAVSAFKADIMSKQPKEGEGQAETEGTAEEKPPVLN